MKTINNKANVKVSKLKHNPLFVNFLNWRGDLYSLNKMLYSVADSFEEAKDKSIALNKAENIDSQYLDNLTNFQKVFTKYIQQTISSKNISTDFVSWMDNAFKYIKENVSTYAQDEYRSISILDESGRWFEGIIIYNFIMTYNYFGSEIIKQCPVCSNFFSHKGKYAKYCSDGCKDTGMKK